jgi:CSLREA domain-containing protein
MKEFWGRRAASRCALLGAILLIAAIGQATAATFVVTTSADSNDGACTVSLCSLRDAIIAANVSGGADIITLPAGTYTLTIAGQNEDAAATGDLDVTGSVTINGAGAATTIIDGGAIDRVFHVLSGTAVINNVTIRNGLAASGGGGGILNAGVASLTLNTVTVTANHTGIGGAGAGIFNNGVLALANSTITGNGAGGGGGGGGVNNQNTMTIASSTITGNSAGPLGGNGSGINNSADLTITNSIISGNTGGGGGNGGGIYNSSELTITASVISGNSAGPSGGNGGGIFNSDDLTITDSTVSANVAAGGGNGAGIYDNGFAVTMNGTTVSGNTTASGDGGGLYTSGVGASITNSTISGNTAFEGGGVFTFGIAVTLRNATIASNTGGGIQNDGISATLTNTIVANNGVNCSGTGPISDGGTNLQFPATTCGGTIASADPLLLALASNGGPTQTQALSAGSPAIDAGTTGCPPTPATDQRGVARPQGFACDIGAFEFLTAGPPPPPAESLPIPTLSQWTLIALSMMIAVHAIGRVRARRR